MVKNGKKFIQLLSVEVVTINPLENHLNHIKQLKIKVAEENTNPLIFQAKINL